MVLCRALRVQARVCGSAKAVVVESRQNFGGSSEALLFEEGLITELGMYAMSQTVSIVRANNIP